MDITEFGQKLREYLGATREGEELTLMDVADFYEVWKLAGLPFEEWIKSYGNFNNYYRFMRES